MRKLAIFTGSFAGAVFAAVLLFPELDRLLVGAVFAGMTLLLALLRRLLPNRARRRALLCCAGIAFGILWTEGYDRLVIAPVRKLDDTTIVLTGMVTDWPADTGNGVNVPVRIRLPEGGSADVLLYMTQDYECLQPGQRVTTVAHCTAADKDGLGRPVNYNTAKGVFLIAIAYGEGEISQPEQVPISVVPVRMMRSLQTGISTVFPDRVQPLVRAIVTGDREQLEPMISSALQRTGLTHTVAVSGMHLAFLAGFLNLLLGRGRRRTALVTIPVVLLFTLMVGCTPSVVRAAVMLILLQLAPLLGREGDTATSLLLALFLLLLHNPYAAADIGLQLSFGAVAGIALFAQRLQDRMTAKLAPGRGIRRLWNAAVRAVAAILSVTLGAQVFTVPLTALYFDTISLISPVANLLCMWAVCALFVLGAVGGCLGIWFPAVAKLLGLAAVPVGEYFSQVLAKLAGIPFAAIPAWPELYRLWLGFIYLVLILGLLLPGRKRLWLPCASMVVTLVVAIGCTLAQLYAAPMQVDVLDVGQGQSVLLRCQNRFVLVDCGGDSYLNPGDIAADRLQSYGRNSLDLLIISHYHDDHANGVPELLKRVNVKRIALPDVEEESSLRQEILALAEEGQIPVFFIREDNEVMLGQSTITIYPPLGKKTANELGLSVLCTMGEYDVLITGDMDADCERNLLDHAQLPDVELMVAGHHGSKHSNSAVLLDAVKPDVAVFSAGAFNRHGHPAPETLERFSTVGAEIYRTDQMGTVTIRVNTKE